MFPPEDFLKYFLPGHSKQPDINVDHLLSGFRKKPRERIEYNSQNLKELKKTLTHNHHLNWAHIMPKRYIYKPDLNWAHIMPKRDIYKLYHLLRHLDLKETYKKHEKLLVKILERMKKNNFILHQPIDDLIERIKKKRLTDDQFALLITDILLYHEVNLRLAPPADIRIDDPRETNRLDLDPSNSFRNLNMEQFDDYIRNAPSLSKRKGLDDIRTGLSYLLEATKDCENKIQEGTFQELLWPYERIPLDIYGLKYEVFSPVKPGSQRLTA